ncbi:MAG TPA: LamG-like jellyroll fold domain-containing protein [Verrucomicrobiae bacterium]|nr:LamG-like jellyroll fold domain-containing protein [Verrucomicrobiae bacterium]
MKLRIRLLVGLSLGIFAAVYFTSRDAKVKNAAPTPSRQAAEAAPDVAAQPAVANQMAPAKSNSVSATASSQVSREFDLTVNPYAGGLREPGKSKRAWDVNFLNEHRDSAVGDPIQFELTEGQMAVGTVQITTLRDGELTYISGKLTEPEVGTFFFLKPPEGGKAGKAVGVVEFPASKKAYRVEPTGLNGDPELWQRQLNEVVCVSLPQPMASATATNIMEMPPLRPDLVPGEYVPSYNSNVVSLQSNPGSSAVLLLDFFGGYTPTWGGVNYVKPANINNATIKEIWKRVAEDYMPFNINVTTDIKVYQNAPETSRQKCCYTDTPVTAAGVAYFGSWNWGGDTPCWSVYNIGKNGAEVGSHEAGHTLGLSHQGFWVGTEKPDNYYAGHGNGETGWAPIMGVGYYQPVVTWAKGEYKDANNQEDALHIITTANNGVTYHADDTGNTLATSRYLDINPDFSVMGEGVIERTRDTDSFQFTTTGGQVKLTARPVGDWSDVGLIVTLANSAGLVLASNNPQSTLHATINTIVPAGTYTFNVTGGGRNNPFDSGFSDYASLGYYSIVGSVPGGSLPTLLSVVEHAPLNTVVGTVTANNPADELTYSIVSGNTANTFSIDSEGVIRVANSAALDYAQIALNSPRAVQYELLVNITDVTNPLLTELKRRVIVKVLSATGNYPVAVTGFNAGVIVPYDATPAAPQASGFDVPNNYSFYQAGLNVNPQVSGSGGLQGLPADGIILSQADNSTFKLGLYGGNNVLMLGNGYPASGTLVLATPQAFTSLSILASSANGGGVGTFILNYTNGTHSVAFKYNAQDWFNTVTNVAVSGLGRLKLGQTTFNTQDNGAGNPSLYQTTLDLGALGINQTISSITFNSPPVGGSRSTGIFAISGAVMPPDVQITVDPVSKTNNNPLASASFGIVATGDPTLGYQWYRGNPGSGTRLEGKTQPTLIIYPVEESDAANYYAVVTNSSSSATSAVASLTVYRAPEITQQPAPAKLVLYAGQKTTLSVAANAAIPTYYYWQTNGIIRPGVSTPNLTLNNLQVSQSADYSVIVSNAFGAVTSSVVSLSVVQPTIPFAQSVLANNPIGYWRLDELSGNIAYDYAGGNNGVYNNTQLAQPGHNVLDSHTSARFGLLSSINSYVGGIPIDFGNTTNGTFTIEAWVNGGSQSTDAGLVTRGTGGGGEQFNLDCGGPGRAFRFFVRDRSGSAHLATGNVVPNGQWHHLVGVCDQSRSNILLYIDGVLNATGSIKPGSGILASTNFVSIGSRQGGTTIYNNQFVGRMEEVAIYNVALSAAQVQAHYQSVTNRPPVFVSNPFDGPDADTGTPYSLALSTRATDPNGDAVGFAKISGPSWLSIAANGSVSGTPDTSDAGLNSFVVRATDSFGLWNQATLNVNVIAPLVVSMSLDGSSLMLNWSGGTPPYQVQQITDMNSGTWENVGEPTTASSVSIETTNTAVFYRIKSQAN